MNNDQVVSKILKLLENNTSFIGYALNGGVGTKINVRNTETGKTIQALSINVDSTGEVLVVKDSTDNQYKAVTFKVAEKVSEKIIQIRKTKPTDDKKIIDYTDVDIEVFYLFVKLIDTGSPVPTSLQSTWIRKGSSCTQFVGAYERCNYARSQIIEGTSYKGLPYTPYSSLQSCLNDDNGPDAKIPHGTSNEIGGGGGGWKYFSSKVSNTGEASMKAALESHDAYYNTGYTKLFGYGSILECSGAMNLQGWETATIRDPITNEITGYFSSCEFSYLPGYTLECTPAMRDAGYCDNRGFISSKCPQYGQQAAGQPSIGNIDSSWNDIYGWKNLSYEFMYKRHFGQLYLNGSTAPGSFYILEVNDDQVPANLPPNFFPWVPGCPSGGAGGPYNGSGGNRFPDGPVPIKKRDMKLSNHKAEIWLGSSKKEEAIKLYELGASDLFSGMYNSFIIRADETRVDVENRLQRGSVFTPTQDEVFRHDRFYENWNKNRIDLTINPRVWVYIVDNVPKVDSITGIDNYFADPTNSTLHGMVSNLYNRSINLTVIDNKTQVVHLKLGLIPRSTLSNSDCKGEGSIGYSYKKQNEKYNSQSWEYQQYKTITIKDWKILSTTSTLNTTLLLSADTWNLDHIQRKFVTSFGGFNPSKLSREYFPNILLRHNSNTQLDKLLSDLHFEQLNYSLKYITSPPSLQSGFLYYSGLNPKLSTSFYDNSRYYALSSRSWWQLWNKGMYSKKTKRLSSVVGYEKNHYQIAKSYGTGANLSYITQGIGQLFYNESYFEYLTLLPKTFVPSAIKALRADKSINSTYKLADRQKITDDFGILFYFSEDVTRWYAQVSSIFIPLVNLPSSYYSQGYTDSPYSYGLSTTYQNTSGNPVMDTRSWLYQLWAQFTYDGIVKVDVDSYKDVNFTLPTNINQYKKFSSEPLGVTSEFPLSTRIYSGQPKIELETVLSPGKLDVTKQVPIKKPSNVDLDPNLSFLLYIFPYTTVTKKKKEI